MAILPESSGLRMATSGRPAGGYHVFAQNNAAMRAVPVEERENFWYKLVEFYETGQQDDLNDFLYKTSIGIMPGGLTMEKTREIEERNRKWLGLE